MVKKRNVIWSIVLTFITFGVYGLVWFIGLTTDSNKISKYKTANGFKAVIFILFSGGLYTVYWCYMMGKKIEAYDRSSNPFVHLLFCCLGLGIFSFIVAQIAINRFADEQCEHC
ncbi:MAG: DUF4234 domain-containing protein [Clostridia bacterium]|nr:DUF4234 domain-containing protein [Clostridia bacterium]